MQNKKQTPEKLLVSGSIFILAGIILLLLTTGAVTGREIVWPIFIILPGLYLLYKAFFKNKSELNILIGMFLFLCGIYILLAKTILHAQEIRMIWPVFMLFSGISLIPYGLRKRKGARMRVFVPAAAIISLSIFFIPFSLRLYTVKFLTFATIWWPFLFIIMGLVLVIIFIVKQYGRNFEKK